MKTVTIHIQTRHKTELTDITRMIEQEISSSGITSGLCFVQVPHTTAAVIINENADPDVQSDIIMALDRIVPWEAGYRHAEGNSAAHVKSVLAGASVTLAVSGGRPVLGTWQAVFFCEFDGPRSRRVNLSFLIDKE